MSRDASHHNITFLLRQYCCGLFPRPSSCSFVDLQCMRFESVRFQVLSGSIHAAHPRFDQGSGFRRIMDPLASVCSCPEHRSLGFVERHQDSRICLYQPRKADSQGILVRGFEGGLFLQSNRPRKVRLRKNITPQESMLACIL
jgi:hypothetical protein